LTLLIVVVQALVMVGVGYGRCWLMVVGVDYQVLIMVMVSGINYGDAWQALVIVMVAWLW
jgi:hypothetical protein